MYCFPLKLKLKLIRESDLPESIKKHFIKAIKKSHKEMQEMIKKRNLAPWSIGTRRSLKAK